MKKFFKNTIVVGIAAALGLISLTGCGAGGNNTANNTAKQSDTIVIGGIGPVTGAAATYGEAVKNGAQLAVDEINAAGGVNGLKLSFNFQDDEHDAEKAVNAYNTLKDAGMQVLMGTVTSTPCVAVAAKAEADNMFMITPSGSAVECTKPDNVFRVCFNDPNQGTASAQYIKQQQLAQKVAVIYNSSDVYSSGIYEKFNAEATNQGLEVVSAQAFTDQSNTDFSVQIQKIKESGAELVFLPIYYQEASLILTQADKAGLKVKFFGCDGLDGIIGQLGDRVDLAEGVMLLTPFAADAKDEKTVKFVSAFKAKYNTTPTQFAADAYDAIYTIKAAMEKAGVNNANISASDLCEMLKPAMTQIEVKGVTGTMTWTADGEPTKEPKGMCIKNGQYTAM